MLKPRTTTTGYNLIGHAVNIKIDVRIGKHTFRIRKIQGRVIAYLGKAQYRVKTKLGYKVVHYRDMVELINKL